MKSFEKVIGYDDVKEELLKVADMFNNPEEYKEIGAHIPKGILIHGRPGMGKTLIANEFADICACNKRIIRKNRNSLDFINEMRNVFEEASKDAPSIIILDDMDKFLSDDDSREEYYSVQACIDEVSDKDVLVVATANYISDMPGSLLRNGRFDLEFELEVLPKGVSERIVDMSLNGGKLLDPSIPSEDVKKLFLSLDPATIQTILNQCKISMKYYKTDRILRTMLIDAFLKNERVAYDSYNTDYVKENVAYHEAGHLVIREIINPQSVSLVAVKTTENGISGIVYGSPVYDRYSGSRKRICESLAGMACEEQKFGYITEGSMDDIRDVNCNLEYDVRLGKCGLELASAGLCFDDSKELVSREQQHVEAEKKRLYALTKKTLIDNWEFVEEVAKKLMECDALMYSDIQNIRNKHSYSELVV